MNTQLPSFPQATGSGLTMPSAPSIPSHTAPPAPAVESPSLRGLHPYSRTMESASLRMDAYQGSRLQRTQENSGVSLTSSIEKRFQPFSINPLSINPTLLSFSSARVSTANLVLQLVDNSIGGMFDLGNSQSTWNGIVDGLNLKKERDKKLTFNEHGFFPIGDADRAETGLYALLQPQRIDLSVWEQEAFAFRKLNEQMARMEKLNSSIRQINSLEAAGWVHIEDQSYFVPNGKGWYKVNKFVHIPLTEPQITALKEARFQMQKAVDAALAMTEQVRSMGRCLNGAHKVQKLTTDPHYVENQFINPTIDALRQATDPMQRATILANFRKKVGDFITSVFAVGNATLKNLDTLKLGGMTKIVEMVVRNIFDRVKNAISTGMGDWMSTQYSINSISGKIDSPLGSLPPEANQLADAKPFAEDKLNERYNKAYTNLYKYFDAVYTGKAKLGYANPALNKILKEIHTLAAIEKNQKKGSLGLTEESPTITALNVNPNCLQDDACAVIEQTKGAFSDFTNARSDDEKARISNHLEWTPTGSAPETQMRLETLLNSPTYSKLYHFPPASECGFEWTAAIVSRLSYLYDRHVKNSGEVQKVERTAQKAMNDAFGPVSAVYYV